MNDIILSENTKEVIGIIQEGFVTFITMKFGMECGELDFHIGNYSEEEEEEKIKNTINNINAFLLSSSKPVFNYIKEMEDEHGGGYMDMGSAKSLRLMSEGDITYSNLKYFVENHKTLIQKLVIQDIAKSGKEELEKFGNICSEFSGKKGRAA